MQLLFDNMIAAVVGFILLMALFLLRADEAESAVGQTSVHAARVMQDGFADVLEVDLTNLGRSVAPGTDAIIAYDPDGTFSFRTTQPGGTGEVPITVEYRRVATGSLDANTPLIQVQRWTNTGTGFQMNGGSSSLVTDWAVTLRDRNDDAMDETDDPTDARTVELRLESALPFANAGSRRAQAAQMKRMVWATVFRPENLRRGASYDLD